MEPTSNIGELVPIKHENGRQVVDARALHAFIGSKRQFGNWIEQRINKYGFIENQDFVSFNKIVKREKGATTIKEYTITTDMAKELCMVENNDKGREARQYFIQKEKEATRQLTPAEMFLQSAQFMVEQERKNRELEQKMLTAQATADTANARLDALEAERKEATNALHQEVLSTEAVPEETLRSKICALVYKFSSVVNISPREAWYKVYDTLFRCYRIKLKSKKQPCDKNLLDTAERTGCLNQIYNIISDMIRSTEQKEKIITVTITH